MDQSRIDLALYRLEQSKQCIASAQLLYDAKDYRGAANRSYYSIFHAMRAVLALEKVDFSKHSAVISYFRKEYIKTGIFEKSLSHIISEAFDIRTDSDYDDFYVISKEEIRCQIENVRVFYNHIDHFIHSKINE